MIGFERHGRRWLACTVAATMTLGMSASAQTTSSVAIDIPAESLGAQLRQLGRDTKTDILFNPDAVANLHGPAVRGSMTAAQAVNRLLKGTALRVSAGAGGSLIVASPRRNVSSAPASAIPDDPPPPTPPGPPVVPVAAPSYGRTQAEAIVVTGTARPQRKLATGYAITRADEAAIRDVAPRSTADLLKVVPGLFTETSGGVSGPNVEVRGFPTAGDSPFVTIQIDGLPIYPTPSLSFLDNSTQIRLDDSVARVEATIGGPAVLFGNGQPGATVNIVQKNGRTDPGGILSFTTGTGGLYQFGGYYGGKVSDGWYGSVGGFYRTDNGVRNTQFPADQGWQVEGTLTHDFDDGSVTIYGRSTKDQNAFFTPIPLLSSGSPSSPTISPYPGFDPLTATFLSNANRFVTFDVGSGENGATPRSMTVDLQKGRGIDNRVVGADFQRSFGDYEFTNKLSYISEEALTIAQFTGATPVTLGSFIDSGIATANGMQTVVNAAGLATAGSATFVTTGGALTNLNQPVISIGVWYVDKRLTGFQDEARLSHQIFDGNTLTIAGYVSNYSSHDLWYLGNNQLMTVQQHAVPLAVKLNNGVKLTSNDGIVSPTSFALNNSYNATNVAPIISDSWQLTDRLRVDGGLRFEFETIDATIGNTAKANLGNTLLDIYDDNGAVLTGTSQGRNYSSSAVAESIDANYKVSRNLNGFIGFNHGYALPTFDDLRSGVSTITFIDQVQAGLKTYGTFYALDVTGFYTKFKGQKQNQLLLNGDSVTYVLGSKTEGVEVDGTLRPLDNLELILSGDYQHGSYDTGGSAIEGKQTLRQPDLQFRFTPKYTLETPVGPLSLLSMVTYVNRRSADVLNLQPLPSYVTLDVGATLDLPHHVELRFSGTNVTNTLGLTEGNARVLSNGVAAGGVFLGRPLFGADYQFNMLLRF